MPSSSDNNGHPDGGDSFFEGGMPEGIYTSVSVRVLPVGVGLCRECLCEVHLDEEDHVPMHSFMGKNCGGSFHLPVLDEDLKELAMCALCAITKPHKQEGKMPPHLDANGKPCEGSSRSPIHLQARSEVDDLLDYDGFKPLPINFMGGPEVMEVPDHALTGYPEVGTNVPVTTWVQSHDFGFASPESTAQAAIDQAQAFAATIDHALRGVALAADAGLYQSAATLLELLRFAFSVQDGRAAGKALLLSIKTTTEENYPYVRAMLKQATKDDDVLDTLKNYTARLMERA